MPATGSGLRSWAVRLATSGRHITLRALLFLGFGSVFLVWLLSAFSLNNGMVLADAESLAIRDDFLSNQRQLNAVRNAVLAGHDEVREALFDQPVAAAPDRRATLQDLRSAAESALFEYKAHLARPAGSDSADPLRRALAEYWTILVGPFPLAAAGRPGDLRALLRDQVLPSRDRTLEAVDAIDAQNLADFQARLLRLSQLRGSLRQQMWTTSVVGVLFGIGIAWLAALSAGRLERRILLQASQAENSRRELERLSSRLLLAQEDERRRVARELHDEIGQELTALKLELAAAQHADTDQADQAFAEARSLAERALHGVRDLSQALHPAMLDTLGLSDAASWYLKGFERRTGIATTLVVEGLDPRVSPAVELCAYRALQEAMTNMSRHSEATAGRVEIIRRNGSLRLLVSDNGKGFPASGGARGLGIVGLKERVADLGGTLRISPIAPHGTELVVELPVGD